MQSATALGERLTQARARTPANSWIRAVGYHESVAGDLDRERLDAWVPDRPLRIQQRGGALWMLNSEALRRLDIDRSPPPGTERDTRGLPNGRLYRADDWLRERLGGDGLPDLWETEGYTHPNGEFVDLPAMGANPLRKDIFVHIDYMKDATHDQRPDDAAIAEIVTAFADAPVSNPDPTFPTGIVLHVCIDHDIDIKGCSRRTVHCHSEAPDDSPLRTDVAEKSREHPEHAAEIHRDSILHLERAYRRPSPTVSSVMSVDSMTECS